MPAEQTSFHTGAPKRFVLDKAKPKKKMAYLGLERRMEARRKQRDRRGDIRFDLSKPDRRESTGRRAEEVLPKFW